MASGIYAITNKINGNQYIGSAMDFRKRWKLHVYQLRHKKHHCAYLQHAWDKNGPDAFEFSIIETCDVDSMIKREQFYIDTLQPVYNIFRTAGSPSGYKLSLETRKKISASLLGHTRNLGRFPSDETRAKMSAAKIKFNQVHGISRETRTKLSMASKGNQHALGAVRSLETRAKMSAAQKGRAVSTKTRAKMSAIKKGIPVSPETRAKISKANTGKKVSIETKRKLSDIVRAWWANKKSKDK
jgi:group I intron endonuclease